MRCRAIIASNISLGLSLHSAVRLAKTGKAGKHWQTLANTGNAAIETRRRDNFQITTHILREQTIIYYCTPCIYDAGRQAKLNFKISTIRLRFE